MSQYAYSYGGSHTGYQTSQPHLYSSNQPYSQPPFHSNEVAESQSLYGQGAAEAYEYNQIAIPGLGMGFTHNAATWQHPASQNLPETHVNPIAPVSHWQTSRADGNIRPESSTLPSQRPDLGVDTEVMEEGELSEGELEDIYEPDEMEANRFGRRDIQPSGSIDGCDRPQLPVENLQIDHWNSKHSGRERSGSYSPYLSPREIQSSGLENGASNVQTPRSGFYDPNKSLLITDDNNEFQRQNEARDGAAIISDSKKHAQDAILRLWPLNVRYHNYIEEGIDRAVLDQLFTELGLELGTTVPRAEQPILPVLSQANTPRSDVLDTVLPSAQATPLVIATEPTAAGSTKDKSEERKDRIARLLAAKGSKATVVGADTNKSGAATPISKNAPTMTKSDKTRTQSEKSKLIQQKMEALMKAREANAKAPPQVPAPPVSSISQPGPDASRSNSQVPVDSTNLDDHSDAAVETTDPSAGPPIPGLFLSSNAPSPAPNQRKRPVAADLNENSTPTIQKRPFGQARESRPFLIHVSDDEDDAEMEIDSPEMRPSSVQRPITPGSRALSFRDNTALPDSGSRSAGSMIDLASMNKKIEDMKRRIAEAEARKKKAKQLGSDSPLPRSETQSKEGSADVTAPATPPVRGASSTAEVARNSPASSAPQPGISPDAVTKLPKIRDQRLQARPSLRARVASERLPIVTAQRMECQEQLKHFQSEVARVKKEIENKLVEEERLKKDAIQTEPVLSPIPMGQEEPEFELHQERPPVDPLPQVPGPHDASIPAENDEMNDSDDEIEQDALMDESPSIASADNRGLSAPRHESQIHEESLVEHERVNGRSPLPTHPSAAHDIANAHGESAIDVEELEEDVAMDEADTSSEEEGAVDDESDDYEPTDAGISLPDSHSPVQHQPSPQRAPDDSAVLETSDTDLQGLVTATPVTKPISTGAGDTESESNREMETRKTTEVSNTAGTTFIPYETPLQYFKAYRFHPRYSDSVAGGLRSLTYSNSIDATREVCPDQLTNGVCPRGSECQFQHFEDMQLPDDQIIVQLGASGNPEVEQQDQYVAGLRELLTDFRIRKVKDFQAISQGLIEYRARFLRDKTKILPLSGVTL